MQHGKPLQIDQPVAICPPQDQRKSLHYVWGAGLCAHTILVRWSVDDHEVVTLLDGYYHVACL